MNIPVQKANATIEESCEAQSRSIAPEQRKQENDEIRSSIKSVQF